MPSSLTFSRKLFSRNGLWHERGYSRQTPCTGRIWPRFLYGFILILLITIVILLSGPFANTQMPVVGCGGVEDTLRSLVVMPTTPRKVVQLGAADGTLYNGKVRNEIIIRDIHKDPLHPDIQTGEARPKVLAFVGIQTGFQSVERRKALRQTWLPSTREGIVRLEAETGLVFRFVIGYTSDSKATEELNKEIEAHGDFLVIDNEEHYARLPFKTLAYFKAAHMLFDADFYVKADDDIYLRPDRLAVLLRKERATPRTYLGCMKKGGVITNSAYKWYEPLGYLLGNEYFLHAYGPIYALSQAVVSDLTNFSFESFRMFSNEDVTIGSWMLAFNVEHEDNRALCDPDCHSNSIAVWDIPRCSGLCTPEQRLPELHAQDMCSKSPTEA